MKRTRIEYSKDLNKTLEDLNIMHIDENVPTDTERLASWLAEIYERLDCIIVNHAPDRPSMRKLQTRIREHRNWRMATFRIQESANPVVSRLDHYMHINNSIKEN